MNWDKNKVWTPEELAIWADKRKKANVDYQAACNIQLDEWVKGNSVHNNISPISGVVDSDNNIVGYFQCEGGECCPDFSCCSGDGWPIDKRKKFVELHRMGNEEACHAMLFGSLSALVNEIPLETDKVYIAGQIGEITH